MLSADSYEYVSMITKASGCRVIEEYSHLLKWPQKGNLRFLDAGCGDGSLTVDVLQKVIAKNVKNYEIIGVDLMDDMIQKAKETHVEEKRIQFQLMDITSVNVPEHFKGNFDTIFSMYCLHWISSDRWIRTLYEMLKQNGQVFLFTILKNSIMDSFFHVSKYDKWWIYLSENRCLESPFLKDTKADAWLRPLLERVGFKNIIFVHDSYKLIYSNRDDLAAFFTTFTAFYKTLPEDMVESFINDMVEFCIEHYQVNGTTTKGEILLSEPHVLIVAEK